MLDVGTHRIIADKSFFCYRFIIMTTDHQVEQFLFPVRQLKVFTGWSHQNDIFIRKETKHFFSDRTIDRHTSIVYLFDGIQVFLRRIIFENIPLSP